MKNAGVERTKRIATMVLFLTISLMLFEGCKSINFKTSPIDCELDDIKIESTLVGTVGVGASHDYIKGELIISCGENKVKGITISGCSYKWWVVAGTLGPSNEDGVIEVAKLAEALGNKDKNTTKEITIEVNGLKNGKEAMKKIKINIPIN